MAAIVIPQFTEASNDARNSALVSDLQTMRSQIELYKVQHGERLPCLAADGVTVDFAANTMLRLTGSTDQLGNIVAAGTAGSFGPYLQRMPTNAFATANGDQISVVTLAAGVAHPAADNAIGWWINTTTGACGASDTAHIGN